jgi:diacylglycerol O-acyltransferase
MHPHWQAPRHAAHPMGWRDVTWLRMDAPNNRMVIHWVAVLDQAPSLAQLHELVAQRLLAYPRFAQRVQRGLLGYWWRPVPSLDPDYHLQERVLPQPVDRAAIEASLAEWAPQALDRTRPLWQWRLLRSRAGGTAALIVRQHHCMTDGDGLVHMLRHLSDDSPQASGHPPLSDPVTGDCRHVAPPPILGSTLSRWLGTAGQLLQLSLLRRDSRHHYRGKPGRDKHLLSSDALPLDELKQVAQMHGVTINDLWLGLVAGALRRHAQGQGGRLDEVRLRAAVTYNLRQRQDAALMGNHFTLTALSLPTHLDDAAQRLRAVSLGMSAIKQSCHPYATMLLMTAFGGLPHFLQRLAMLLFTSKGSLVSTNLQGPAEFRYLAGIRICEFHCWVPQTGDVGLGLMLSTYAGNAILSVSCDAKMVQEPRRLLLALQEELRLLRRAFSTQSDEGPVCSTKPMQSGSPAG